MSSSLDPKERNTWTFQANAGESMEHVDGAWDHDGCLKPYPSCPVFPLMELDHLTYRNTGKEKW